MADKRARPAAGDPPPAVSVLMPCRNAMPYLPEAVGSVLAQEGLREHGGLELLVVDDGSTDGSGAFLAALAAALSGGGARPAKRQRRGDEDDEDEDEDADSPAAVASRVAEGNALVVLDVKAYGPSGQGLALNAARAKARGALVGEMESDDVRPPHTFAALRRALEDNPGWDAAASEVEVFGWDRPGMRRYVEWQNSCRTPEQLASRRFIEIPALRASALYRRAALDRLGAFRDIWEVEGTLVDCARAGGSLDDAADTALPGWWPVDMDFWMRWFELRLVCGKVPEALYRWRQYPTQSTRTHSRCSQERLRACRAYFLTKPGGPAHRRPVQLFSVGDTLAAWKAELKTAGVDFSSYSWAPKMPFPEEAKEKHTENTVRLFAFGMEKARGQIRKRVSPFREGELDWFVC